MTLLALGINHKTAPYRCENVYRFRRISSIRRLTAACAADGAGRRGAVDVQPHGIYLSVEEQDNLQEALIRWLCIITILMKKICVKASTGIRITRG